MLRPNRRLLLPDVVIEDRGAFPGRDPPLLPAAGISARASSPSPSPDQLVGRQAPRQICFQIPPKPSL